jgi:hypothetical protein
MPEEGELRFIPTRTHGVIDYLMGALLIVAPYLLGFADDTMAQWVPQIAGAALICLPIYFAFVASTPTFIFQGENHTARPAS